MPAEMAINLPIEKTRQRLLKYFETRDDLEVKSSEPKSVEVQTWGHRFPWINIRIGMFEEENRTRLAVDFSFYTVYAILSVVALLGIIFIWVLPQSVISSIILSVVIGACALISFASEISKAKKKFLEDIRKAFNKTD